MTCKGLTHWREKRGYSQEELAQRSGIPQPQISRYEHGQWPGKDNLKKLAKALDVKSGDLIAIECDGENA